MNHLGACGVATGLLLALTLGAAESVSAKAVQVAVAGVGDTNRAAAASAGADAARPQSLKERLEQIKRDNPGQYAEMLKRRDAYRQSLEKKDKERVDFFGAVSTKNMSEAQKEAHAKLLAALKTVSELRGKLQTDQPDSGAASVELRRRLGEAMSGLRDLYAAERRFLLEDTVRSLGATGTNVAAYADQLQAIFDLTSMSGGVERSAPVSAR